MGRRVLRRAAGGRGRRAVDSRGLLTPLDPLFTAPALGILGLDALAILAVYVAARRAPGPWGGLTLRLLAVLGILVPVWTVLAWYGELARAREWARDLPIRTGPVLERFLLNSVALFTFGFMVLVCGIYLARRLPKGGQSPPEEDSG